jgi:hypothetical protein
MRYRQKRGKIHFFAASYMAMIGLGEQAIGKLREGRRVLSG